MVVAELLCIDFVPSDIATLVEIVVVVSDLMSKLADCWNFDGTRPVRVHERLTEGEILDILLRDLVMRLVQSNVEVRRFDTANCCLLRHQEEIKALFICVLNKLRVNDGSWRWIHHLTALLAEHSLIDSLVYHD